MMTSRWTHRGRMAGECLVAVVVLISSACENDGARRSAVGRPASRRLDGAWEITMRLDRRMSLSATPAALPFTLRGTVTMMTNEMADVSFAPMPEPTEIGVYALHLDSLGLAAWSDGGVPALAARVRPPRPTSASATHDSVSIVLNPAVPTRIVRLAGVLIDDEIRGDWTAQSPLGGGGTFAMHRASAAPATIR